MEGIDPGVIAHHLNLDPNVKPVMQKRRYKGLLSARHIKEIQFPELLSNIVLVPKPGGKWRLCIDFRDLNKACPKDFYPLPRIDQLVDSTSGCELLSMIEASQGYHQIMLALEDHKNGQWRAFPRSYGNQRSIEANLTKIKAILDMGPPTSINEVQHRKNGRT
ncbi:UNVERIFIED_CONTAM: Transposon Ty3-G Gag-Pol polyprotein [Sesamum radiatum]|uniref:Transposon Ty3-G Gag-Pol polyprotein n=1 Tax=Sesamum radiatum TaxID=300843 RepID=A0AAW2UNP2_SESRA